MVDGGGSMNQQQLTQNCKYMRNASKFAAIKFKNFLDLNMIQKGTFRTLSSTFSVHEICYDLIEVMDQHMKSK